MNIVPSELNSWIKLGGSLAAGVVFVTIIFVKVEASESADIDQDATLDEFKSWVIQQESLNKEIQRELAEIGRRNEMLLEHLLEKSE